MAITLRAIVDALGGQFAASSQVDGDSVIQGIAPLATAKLGNISFLSHIKYAADLQETNASCVILLESARAHLPKHAACIVSPQPYLYFARLTQWWRAQTSSSPVHGIHPSAVIHPDAVIHPQAFIGPLCYVGAGASIAAGSRLVARVSVGEGCRIGERCILHPGVVIGADGFGFAPREDGSWEKIEQLGAVRIGDDVEIGANTCIDRGALDDTVIENGVKIDNLVQIGHNVRIGKHSALAGNAGVAGSANIGAYCTVGGGAVILGHLTIADHVHISASTTVTRSISEPGLHTGIFPIDKNADWERNAVTLRQLSKLRDRIRELEKRLPVSPPSH
jgi:UDP-3-O-[3-hydroxymyristoyl] glucosamine N-acyltransferase